MNTGNTHNGRRNQRRRGARAHSVIEGIESQRGPLSTAQKRRIIAQTGAAPYPPRQGTPRKWARRVIAANNTNQS
jgi:hypothetical protein